MQLSISLKSITNVLKLSIAMILKVALELSQVRGFKPRLANNENQPW